MYRAMCTDGAFDDHLPFPEGKTKQLSWREQQNRPMVANTYRGLTWWGRLYETCGSNPSWTTYFGLNRYSQSPSQQVAGTKYLGACARSELMVLAWRAPLCVRTWTRFLALSGRVADRCWYLPVNGSWTGFLAGLQGQRLIPRQTTPEYKSEGVWRWTWLGSVVCSVGGCWFEGLSGFEGLFGLVPGSVLAVAWCPAVGLSVEIKRCDKVSLRFLFFYTAYYPSL